MSSCAEVNCASSVQVINLKEGEEKNSSKKGLKTRNKHRRALSSTTRSVFKDLIRTHLFRIRIGTPSLERDGNT